MQAFPFISKTYLKKYIFLALRVKVSSTEIFVKTWSVKERLLLEKILQVVLF